MKIDVYSNMHNEEFLLPYWLRHYEKIADRIFVWDDDSADATGEILAKHQKVTILPIGMHNSHDEYWIEYLFPQYEEISRGHADWVMIADADEFIYHRDLLRILGEEKEKGTEIIRCQGYSMVSDGPPTTTGQIYDEIKMGLPDRMETKWSIHSPDVKIRFSKGRHGHVAGNRSFKRNFETGIKNLHYRYLGEEFFESRDKRIFERAWARDPKLFPPGKVFTRDVLEFRVCPDHTLGNIYKWFAVHKKDAVNVVDAVPNSPSSESVRIDVYSIMHNEERILPYWLKHYETIADRIFVWDDDSTDKTREILEKHPKVTILTIGKHNTNDDYWIEHVFPQCKKISRGYADWVIIADADEFIYHPDLKAVLKLEKIRGTKVIQAAGFSMVSDVFPTTNGQIYDEIKRGLPDRMESKWTIHSPDSDIRFARGRHGPIKSPAFLPESNKTGIKLFHYRFLGKEYLEARDKKLFERHVLMNDAIGMPSRVGVNKCPDGSRGPLLEWFESHKSEAVNVVDESNLPEIRSGGVKFPAIMELAQQDFWRATMYTKIFESVNNLNIKGDGVEFGGSNGVIQSMFPCVKWETRNYPPFDITDPKSFGRNWDIIVADQVLEHVSRPWDAINLIGTHAVKLAILTVPFLIGIHPSPHDYWRMTPRTIADLARPYFRNIEIGSWGTVKANNWHSVYNRTANLYASVPVEEIEAEMNNNDPKKPFVIWALLKK